MWQGPSKYLGRPKPFTCDATYASAFGLGAQNSVDCASNDIKLIPCYTEGFVSVLWNPKPYVAGA